jgi:signal transduction histidine kinase
MVRSVKGLLETLEKSRTAVRALAVLGLTEDEFSVIDRIKSLSTERESERWDPIELADREDVISTWLDEVGGAAEEVGALAEVPIGLDELKVVTTSLPPEKLKAVLHWLACWLMASQISGELEDSAAQIFHLVSAVKAFSHMDRALNPEPLDLRDGIQQALVLVQEKTSESDVEIGTEIPSDLPKVRGIAGELSQMWHSLIENAVDAAGSGGTVRISAARGNEQVRVEVMDDGPGVPEEILDRIFDPFFTTKPVGQGTGLGLELVRRVVDQHRGEIEVESIPGRTVFRISLPVNGA